MGKGNDGENILSVVNRQRNYQFPAIKFSINRVHSWAGDELILLHLSGTTSPQPIQKIQAQIEMFATKFAIGAHLKRQSTTHI